MLLAHTQVFESFNCSSTQSGITKRRCFFERISSTIDRVKHGGNENGLTAGPGYKHMDDTAIIDHVFRVSTDVRGEDKNQYEIGYSQTENYQYQMQME